MYSITTDIVIAGGNISVLLYGTIETDMKGTMAREIVSYIDRKDL